jgi:hypothetical protein
VDLKLADYLHQVLQHNESIQAQMLDAEVNRRKERCEFGIFEPQLAASVTREANRRTNNVQQSAAANRMAITTATNGCCFSPAFRTNPASSNLPFQSTAR